MKRSDKRAKLKTTASKEHLIKSDDDDEINYAYDNSNTLTEVQEFSNETDDPQITEEKRYVLQKFLQNKSPRRNKANTNVLQNITPPHKLHQTNKNDDNEDASSGISNISNATYDAPSSSRLTSFLQKKNSLVDVTKANENIEMTSIQNADQTEEINDQINNESESNLDNINKTKKRDKAKRKINRIKHTADDEQQEILDLPQNQNINGEKSIVNQVLAIHIIKTNRLQLNSYLLGAFVRIHFIDSETNEYVKKSDPQRCVNIHNATKNLRIDYIDSFTTQVFNFMHYNQECPLWNEAIVINDDYSYLQNHHTMMIFFEIVESAMNQIVAWAFLKPQSNYERNLRLQLYHSQNLQTDSKYNSYNWWKQKKMRKYPSTLYVRLNETSMAENVSNTKVKRSSEPKEMSTEILGDVLINKEKVLQPLPKLDKLFKLSKHKVMEIPVGDLGCLIHKFSNNGAYLAFATSEDNMYKIIIYELSNHRELCRLEHHDGLIYDLMWSSDDTQLFSASADSTVAIWDVPMQKLESVLSHPSYVYCCVLFNDKYIATGCFDHRIRFWSLASYALETELKEHKGYVTSICFDKENNFMYSADSTGCILRWQNRKNVWGLKQSVSVMDMKDVTINQIILHRRGRRLIVNYRDGYIRLVDIKTGYVLATFNKGSNKKANMKCVLTPCNAYLLSGTESGDVYVWQVDNEKVEQVFSPYHEAVAIHCIQYEPKHNLIAVSHFGKCMPIIVYGPKTNEQVQSVRTTLAQLVTHTNTENSLAKVEKGANFRMILEKFDKIIIKS